MSRPTPLQEHNHRLQLRLNQCNLQNKHLLREVLLLRSLLTLSLLLLAGSILLTVPWSTLTMPL